MTRVVVVVVKEVGAEIVEIGPTKGTGAGGPGAGRLITGAGGPGVGGLMTGAGGVGGLITGAGGAGGLTTGAAAGCAKGLMTAEEAGAGNT